MKFLALIIIFFYVNSAVAQGNFYRGNLQRQWPFGSNRRALFSNGQLRVFPRNLYGRRPFNRFVRPLFPLPINVDPNPDVTVIPSEPEFVIQPIPEITPGPTQEVTLVKAVVSTPLEASAVTEDVGETGVEEPEEEEEEATSITAEAAVPLAVKDLTNPKHNNF